jgi:hypothetical protein
LLRPGLPFAVFTPSFNYVTAVALRQNRPPPELKLTKYFYGPDVEELENQLVEVQTLGRAAEAEWFKGLQIAGKDRQADAERLEHWESSLASRLKINMSTSSDVRGTQPLNPSLPSMVSAPSQISTWHSHQGSAASPSRSKSARSSQFSDHTSSKF